MTGNPLINRDRGYLEDAGQLCLAAYNIARDLNWFLVHADIVRRRLTLVNRNCLTHRPTGSLGDA